MLTGLYEKEEKKPQDFYQGLLSAAGHINENKKLEGNRLGLVDPH